MLKKVCLIGMLLVILVIAVTACGPAETTSVASGEPIKVGALSIIPMLPLYVAQEEGLFEAQGLNVEIVPFTSVLDRDTALHAGQLDCIVDDIFSGMLLNKDESVVKVAAVTEADAPMFYIIASQESQINTAGDLKNVEIAVSLNTILDYATEQLLVAEGLQLDEILKTSIPSMPLRLEMMNQGQIQAATFSPPLSDVAVYNGNKVICDDGQQALVIPCIMFTVSSLESRPGDVEKFLAAWSQAARRITDDPQSYSGLLVQVANVPAEIADTISVPDFDALRAPTADEFQSKADWMSVNGLIGEMSYQDIVTPDYLPE